MNNPNTPNTPKTLTQANKIIARLQRQVDNLTPHYDRTLGEKIADLQLQITERDEIIKDLNAQLAVPVNRSKSASTNIDVVDYKREIRQLKNENKQLIKERKLEKSHET